MAIEKTEAVILKSFPYSDTSKIARCYTRKFGKVSIIARGVRKGKTAQSGYLEPMNYLTLVYYHNPKRQLQTFSKAEFRKIWPALKKDVKKVSYGFAVVELMDRAVIGEEPHEQLFQLLVDILQAINDGQGRINLIFWYFEIQLLTLLGFRPVLSACPRCHGDLKGGLFSFDYGELVCGKCESGGGLGVSERAIGILRKLKTGTLEKAAAIVLKRGDRKEVGGFLNDYLRYHIEGLDKVKSLSVMEKVLS